MKKAKKIVALLLCAVLLISASVAGTLAYLTQKTATVQNTFTVGKVSLGEDEDGDGIVEGGLDGTKVEQYGVAVTPASRVTKNTYKLIPGHTYIKDPTIHVAVGSEKAYLFVKVVNGIEGIEAEDVAGQTATTIDGQMKDNDWEVYDADNNIYVYKNTVDTVDATDVLDVPVFGSFTLAKDADVGSYAGTDGKVSATITVTAYAVQADGLTRDQAWAALAAKYPS